MATKQTPKTNENAVIRWAARDAGFTVANRGAIPGKVAAWWIGLSERTRKQLRDAHALWDVEISGALSGTNKAAPAALDARATKPRARRERLTATQRRDALVAIGDAIEQTIKMLEESRELVLALINAR